MDQCDGQMDMFEVFKDIEQHGLIPRRLTDTNIPDRNGSIIIDGRVTEREHQPPNQGEEGEMLPNGNRDEMSCDDGERTVGPAMVGAGGQGDTGIDGTMAEPIDPPDLAIEKDGYVWRIEGMDMAFYSHAEAVAFICGFRHAQRFK